MSILVIIVGLINVGAGLLGVLAPEALKRLAGRFWKANQGYLGALLFRLALSAMLIVGSRYCRFRVVILVLGILSAVTAIGILFAGQERQNRLREWTLTRPNNKVRMESLVGILIGGFLIYASL